MADRVQAAIAALRQGLDVLDRNAVLKRAAVNVGHAGHLRHAERVVAIGVAWTEASPAPSMEVGLGRCSIRHPIHAPRTALHGLLTTFGDLPATTEINAVCAELRRHHGALCGASAGRA